MKKMRHMLAADRSGVATVEFALWSTLFFMVMLAALDISQFTIARGRVAQAMSGASLAVFKSRTNVDFAALPAYLRAASGLADPAQMTVTMGCNGGTDNCTNAQRSCACLSRTGTLVPTASCGQSCGGDASANSQSGYYLQATASYPYRPVFLPRGLMANSVVRQTMTVRLQ
jgi:Flp pilus assembly protein TadG